MVGKKSGCGSRRSADFAYADQSASEFLGLQISRKYVQNVSLFHRRNPIARFRRKIHAPQRDRIAVEPISFAIHIVFHEPPLRRGIVRARQKGMQYVVIARDQQSRFAAVTVKLYFCRYDVIFGGKVAKKCYLRRVGRSRCRFRVAFSRNRPTDRFHPAEICVTDTGIFGIRAQIPVCTERIERIGTTVPTACCTPLFPLIACARSLRTVIRRHNTD